MPEKHLLRAVQRCHAAAFKPRRRSYPHAAGDDPFNWIKGHPLMTPEITARYPFDHAGQGAEVFLGQIFAIGRHGRRQQPASGRHRA